MWYADSFMRWLMRCMQCCTNLVYSPRPPPRRPGEAPWPSPGAPCLLPASPLPFGELPLLLLPLAGAELAPLPSGVCAPAALCGSVTVGELAAGVALHCASLAACSP